MHAHRVRALLMGGQACVFYGAAEFSRDTDFAILADATNLSRLRRTLADLQARLIAMPPLELRYLRRGHAIHFRCQHPEARRMRIDVMSRMRGVDSFDALWRRRLEVELPGKVNCTLLSLPDLVQAKKTQRDKDWPMIRRLVEAHYFEHREQPNRPRIEFWLRELRTPQLLIELAGFRSAPARRLVQDRRLLVHALSGNVTALERALVAEEMKERSRDKSYWRPLLKVLERLRHERISVRRRSAPRHQRHLKPKRTKMGPQM